MEFIEVIAIAIGVTYSTLGIVLLFIDLLTAFWDRRKCEYTLSLPFQKFKWGFSDDWEIRGDDIGNIVWSLISDVFLGVIVWGITYCILTAFITTPIAFPIVIGILLFIIIPRYLKDLIKMLKYNTKTRDSDRLIKLEAEISKLKDNN